MLSPYYSIRSSKFERIPPLPGLLPGCFLSVETLLTKPTCVNKGKQLCSFRPVGISLRAQPQPPKTQAKNTNPAELQVSSLPDPVLG